MSETGVAGGRLRMLEGLGARELLIHEVYASVQGESTHAGKPCSFVRTTGCPLRCGYCDTPHAFTEGKVRSVDTILDEVTKLGIPLVEVTGGEPLSQPNIQALLRELCDQGFQVLLETSGALSIAEVDERVHCIVDFKCPSSGEDAQNLWSNIDVLRPHHEVKFVVGGKEDFDWAIDVIREHALCERVPVLLSPVWGDCDHQALADWVVSSGLPIRMQIQMHKFVWGSETRGV